MSNQGRLWPVSAALVFVLALAGCSDEPDCTQYSTSGTLSFVPDAFNPEDCPTLEPLNRVPPAHECTPGCTCTVAPFELYTEQTDVPFGSDHHECRSPFSEACADGTLLTCVVSTGDQPGCELTRAQKGPDWVCSYEIRLEGIPNQ